MSLAEIRELARNKKWKELIELLYDSPRPSLVIYTTKELKPKEEASKEEVRQ